MFWNKKPKTQIITSYIDFTTSAELDKWQLDNPDVNSLVYCYVVKDKIITRLVYKYEVEIT